MSTAAIRHHLHGHVHTLPHIPIATWRRILTPIAAALLAMSLARSVGAQEQKDSLTAARDLYASAAYDEALSVLNRLRSSSLAQNEAANVQQVRALCLLALGRSSEAEQAIEEVIAAEPMYQPSESDASPRVRAAFVDVRKRMLPTIAQQQYALAKNAYEHKDYATAVRLFKRTMDVLQDPAVTQSKEPGLGDLKTLTAGFLDLSVAAATPPPPPPAPEPAPAPPAPAPSAPPPPSVPRIYFAGDEGVVAPLIIKQDMPRWPLASQPSPSGQGVIEVIIGEDGLVESAVIRESVARMYDNVLVAAARNWKYRPATRNGRPVKFRKLVQVTLEGRK
jgi:TonB family protein